MFPRPVECSPLDRRIFLASTLKKSPGIKPGHSAKRGIPIEHLIPFLTFLEILKIQIGFKAVIKSY
jgi:hypothetical protein